MFGDVCVLGLGVSGRATATFCLDAIASRSGLVSSLTIYAGQKTPSTLDAAQPFIDAGINVLFDTENVTGIFDTCVASPGISERSDFYKSGKAASRTIMTEPEFAFRLSPKHWIAITGTNGKTTTTALTAHLLDAAGIPTVPVGNIGDPCITAVAKRLATSQETYLAAELSSYQLASVSTLAPQVAILLNITPDHLSWHGSHEAYAAAKMKVFEHLGADALAIVVTSDPEAAACVQELRDRGLQVLCVDVDAAEALPNSATCIDGRMIIRFGDNVPIDLGPVDDLAIRGPHNTTNALCAASAALFCGAQPAYVAEGLVSFAALEHRCEPCGVVDGVAYYNDSKATNTDAVLKALTAFPTTPPVLLLGGKDKGTDLTELVQECERSCKAIICFGASKQRFLSAFADASLALYEAEHLVDALDLARNLALPGDVVLLSPACASFDEFSCFEERGECFKAHVASWTGAAR